MRESGSEGVRDKRVMVVRDLLETGFRRGRMGCCVAALRADTARVITAQRDNGALSLRGWLQANVPFLAKSR